MDKELEYKDALAPLRSKDAQQTNPRQFVPKLSYKFRELKLFPFAQQR